MLDLKLFEEMKETARARHPNATESVGEWEVPPHCTRCNCELHTDGQKICSDCAVTVVIGYEFSRKTGSRSNGASSAGFFYHARLLRENGYPEHSALCGTQPGTKRAEWSLQKYNETQHTICPRCAEKLQDYLAAKYRTEDCDPIDHLKIEECDPI